MTHVLVRLLARPARILFLLAFLTAGFPVWAAGAGPRSLQVGACPRYGLSPKFTRGTFTFAGEAIPLDRPDVARRVQDQVNFLLLDARSVLMNWLNDKARHGWLFEEILKKERLPFDFVLLAPIMSSLSTKAPSVVAGAGWWALEKACGAADGAAMDQNAFLDDRLDLELSTRCFVSRLKRIKADLGQEGWLMSVAAYVTSTGIVAETAENWKCGRFWDIPLPAAAESLVTRWVALAMIDGDKAFYGVQTPSPAPLSYDRVTGLILAKDLTVAQIAKLTGSSPKTILELNPRIRPGKGALPALVEGKRTPHHLSVPKGKGASLVDGLVKTGYLMEKRAK